MPAIADLNTAATPELAMSELARGTRGRVTRVLGNSADSLRLKSLGICEGREVTVLRTGTAWVVRVLGSRVGISPQLAATIFLTTISG